MIVRYEKSEKCWLKWMLPFYFIRYFFHILTFWRYSRYIPELVEDLNNECVQYGIEPIEHSRIKFVSLLHPSVLFAICWGMAMDPYFLTLFYWRLKGKAQFLRVIKPDKSSFHIYCGHIGHNLIMYHPFSTIVNARRIGDNVMIRNNTTIGDKDDNNRTMIPTIGNNVNIGPGCIIFGDITIGDNVVIGAGTLVNKDVPANSVVAGNPFRILRMRVS